jgi:acyl carrier protein
VPATSDADVLERASETRWDSILSGIRADGLDCLQSTVAVIADAAYGSGSHLALGSRWRFPVRGPDGIVRVQPSVAERMAQAGDMLGLKVSAPQGPMESPELRALAATAPVYVVAEAYDLSWLPYARATVRYREMPHSFLLERSGDTYTVIDAYYADTEWGRARPGTWTMSAAELDTAIGGPGTAIRMTATGTRLVIDRAKVMADNALTAKAAGPDIEDYVATAKAELNQAEGIERLVLDIWHLTRERLLYKVWLGEHEAAAEVDAAAEAWQVLAGQSYLASRRVRRGAAPNAALIDDMAVLLRSDAALMTKIGTQAAGASIPDVVREVIADNLQLDIATIEPASELRELPGYDSFRLVEIIDEVEHRLGIEFPADASAGDLVDVAGLCRLFARAAGS